MGADSGAGGIGKTIALALAAALLVKVFTFDFFIAEGESMLPVIQPGSILLLNRVAYGLRLPWSSGYLLSWKAPRPGDVVVFSSPVGSVAVKRIAQIVDGRAFIALGDNPGASYDSRAYGPVPTASILGKVVPAR